MLARLVQVDIGLCIVCTERETPPIRTYSLSPFGERFLEFISTTKQLHPSAQT
jgi:hypothetical protein